VIREFSLFSNAACIQVAWLEVALVVVATVLVPVWANANAGASKNPIKNIFFIFVLY
jgi:hypothetical protein